MSRFVYPDWQLPPDYDQPSPTVRVDPDAEFLSALGAENAMSDFIAARQAALYSGNNPLFTKQGKTALDAAPAVLDRLGQLRDQAVSQAPSSRRRDLQERLELHLGEAREDIDRHLAEQRKAWHRQTAEKRQATNRAEAALSFDDFDKLMLLAGINEDAAREVAKASGVDPDSDAEKHLITQARSQTYRAAVEGALQRVGRQAGIALFDRVKNALSPDDREELGRHIDDQRRRQAAQDYVDKILPAMPATLAEAEVTYTAATAQNDTEFAHDPVQRATNRHVIDVRFGTHSRGLQQAKTDLTQAVEAWITQPATDGQPQTERPPSPTWVRLSPEEQEEVDRRLKLNAFEAAAPGRGIAPNVEPVPGSPEHRAAEASTPPPVIPATTIALPADGRAVRLPPPGAATMAGTVARAGEQIAQLVGRAAGVVPHAGAAATATATALPLIFIPTNTQSSTVELDEGLRARIRPGQRSVTIERKVDGGFFGTGVGAKWEDLPIDAEIAWGPQGRAIQVNPDQLKEALGEDQAERVLATAGATPPSEPQVIPPPVAYEMRIGDFVRGDAGPSFREASEEKISQVCQNYPTIYGFALEASQRAQAAGIPNGLTYGNRVDREAKTKIREMSKVLEKNGILKLQPEIALRNGRKFSYFPKGSSVLDVLEIYDNETICIYDFKTGGATFPDRVMTRYIKEAALYAKAQKLGYKYIYAIPVWVP